MVLKLLAGEIKQLLNEHLGDIVVDVIIFGSRVKGTSEQDSDYDVLIILKTSYDRKIQKQINDLCYDFDLKYNIFLDTQIITEGEIGRSIRGKHPIFKNAIKEGVHA
jgi:predicted nucleotidyltransferase